MTTERASLRGRLCRVRRGVAAAPRATSTARVLAVNGGMVRVMTTSRRDVLVFGASAFALGASGCAILRGGAVHPQWAASQASLTKELLTIPLADIRAVGEGRVLEARLEPAFRDLLFSPRADGTVVVVTANCPHRGCVVDFDASHSEWQCPCHDSRFSLEGVVKSGAAKKNLLVPVTRVEGESLVVELERLRGPA